jgi:hypothetical protein
LRRDRKIAGTSSRRESYHLILDREEAPVAASALRLLISGVSIH